MHGQILTKGISVRHNGDYSGDATFTLAGYAERRLLDPDTFLVTSVIKAPVEVDIPFSDLLRFVMDYLRGQKISRLKDMGTEQLVEHFLDCE